MAEIPPPGAEFFFKGRPIGFNFNGPLFDIEKQLPRFFYCSNPENLMEK